MPTIHASPAAEPTTGDEFARGYYLTDGRRLFRVVSQFTTTLSPYAELEDCMTLTVDRYTPTELWVMGIHSVPRVG
jgi:hypothetical protein